MAYNTELVGIVLHIHLINKNTHLAQVKVGVICKPSGRLSRTGFKHLSNHHLVHSTELAIFKQLSCRAIKSSKLHVALAWTLVQDLPNIWLWKKKNHHRTSLQTSTNLRPLWLRQFCSWGVCGISNGNHHSLPGWNYWGLIGLLLPGWVVFKSVTGLNKMEEVRTAFLQGPLIPAKIQLLQKHLPSQFDATQVCQT